MKFILGYIPNTKSTLYNGPKIYWFLKVRHGRKFFAFERVLRDENGLMLPKLRVYDSADYPDLMIQDLLHYKQIVEWHGDKIITEAEDCVDRLRISSPRNQIELKR